MQESAELVAPTAVAVEKEETDSESISGDQISQSFGGQQGDSADDDGSSNAHKSSTRDSNKQIEGTLSDPDFNLGNYSPEDMAQLTRVTQEMNRRMD